MSSDDGRELVANIFVGAGLTAGAIAKGLPEPFKAAVLTGAALATVIGNLVRSIGTDNTKALIDELQRKKDEGKITDSHIASDDKAISDAVSDLYKGSA